MNTHEVYALPCSWYSWFVVFYVCGGCLPPRNLHANHQSSVENRALGLGHLLALRATAPLLAGKRKRASGSGSAKNTETEKHLWKTSIEKCWGSNDLVRPTLAPPTSFSAHLLFLHSQNCLCSFVMPAVPVVPSVPLFFRRPPPFVLPDVDGLHLPQAVSSLSSAVDGQLRPQLSFCIAKRHGRPITAAQARVVAGRHVRTAEGENDTTILWDFPISVLRVPDGGCDACGTDNIPATQELHPRGTPGEWPLPIEELCLRGQVRRAPQISRQFSNAFPGLVSRLSDRVLAVQPIASATTQGGRPHTSTRPARTP